MAIELPKVVYALLCEDIRREVGDKPSLMGVFSKFHVHDFEKPLHPFYVASLWLFEDQAPKKITVRVTDSEGGDVRKRLEVETPRLEEEKNEFDAYGLNVFTGIRNLKVERPGKYFVVFKLGEREMAQVPFIVIEAKKDS